MDVVIRMPEEAEAVDVLSRRVAEWHAEAILTKVAARSSPLSHKLAFLQQLRASLKEGK